MFGESGWVKVLRLIYVLGSNVNPVRNVSFDYIQLPKSSYMKNEQTPYNLNRYFYPEMRKFPLLRFSIFVESNSNVQFPSNSIQIS